MTCPGRAVAALGSPVPAEPHRTLRKAAWGSRRWGKGTAFTWGPGVVQREPGACEGHLRVRGPQLPCAWCGNWGTFPGLFPFYPREGAMGPCVSWWVTEGSRRWGTEVLWGEGGTSLGVMVTASMSCCFCPMNKRHLPKCPPPPPSQLLRVSSRKQDPELPVARNRRGAPRGGRDCVGGGWPPFRALSCVPFPDWSDSESKEVSFFLP